jgi:hypothetical protein
MLIGKTPQVPRIIFLITCNLFCRKGFADGLPKKISPYRFFCLSLLAREVFVKKGKTRFETVPLAEVLKKAIDVDDGTTRKAPKKGGSALTAPVGPRSSSNL